MHRITCSLLCVIPSFEHKCVFRNTTFVFGFFFLVRKIPLVHPYIVGIIVHTRIHYSIGVKVRCKTTKNYINKSKTVFYIKAWSSLQCTIVNDFTKKQALAF